MLLLSALSEGTTNVENLLESADIRYMLEALKQLKVCHDYTYNDTEQKILTLILFRSLSLRMLLRRLQLWADEAAHS